MDDLPCVHGAAKHGRKRECVECQKQFVVGIQLVTEDEADRDKHRRFTASKRRDSLYGVEPRVNPQCLSREVHGKSPLGRFCIYRAGQTSGDFVASKALRQTREPGVLI